jgi:hypothetical protein
MATSEMIGEGLTFKIIEPKGDHPHEWQKP